MHSSGLGHDHGAAADVRGEDHGAGEAFPRMAVRDLVGTSLVTSRRRELLQDSAIATGLALLALALPTERLFGDGPGLVQATSRGEWLSANVLLSPLAQVLSRLPAIGAERAWFLIAALCWAATYPVLSRMCIALGMSRTAACTAALLVLVSPLGFLSATLPGPSAALLLGSALLLESLLIDGDRGAAGKRVMGPLGTWFAVCLLDPNLLMLLPAVVWKGVSTRRAGLLETSAKVSLGLVVISGLFFVGLAAHPPGDRAPSVLQALELKLLGSGSGGAPDSLTFLIVLAPLIGVGVIGLVELLRRPTGQGEAALPGWALALVGLPLGVKLIGGSPNLDTGAWAFGPLTALGIASLLDRGKPERRMMVISSLFASQIALSCGFRVTSTIGDPRRAWVNDAALILEPGDLVLTRDQSHDYLLRHRFGVSTVNLRTPVELDETSRVDWWASTREQIRTQARSGGRVVVDWRVGEPPGGQRPYAFQRELYELMLLVPIRYLDPAVEAPDASLGEQLRTVPKEQ